MTLPIQSLAARVLSTLLCGSALVACGGGGGGAPANSSAQSASLVVAQGTTTPSAPSTISSAPAAIPALTTGAAVTMTAITDVRFENTGTAAQTNVPVTFGQVFAVGDLLPTDGLAARLADGTTLPLQVDVKARHANGSVRHAIISAVLPSLPAGVQTVTLVKGGSAAAPTLNDPDDMMGAGFSASAHATINGVRYNAFADDLIKEGPFTTWLDGAAVKEWHVSGPLTNSAGTAHPHLTARFAIRWYPAIKKARVDVTVENDWAYEPGPQNITYDAEVLVAAKQAWAKPALNHLHHSRWRKIFWWGGSAPQVNTKLNTNYLIATRALPNFDQSLTVPETALNGLATTFSGARTEPMAVGMANPYMPSTGGRDDIGLLPGWGAVYLLTMDKRARDATLGTADLAGSWSSHYRDKNTGRPVSLKSYPYMTILGNPGDTYNPATKKYESFPTCAVGASCATPNGHDTSHQPAFAYLPYLVTGDYYYLEELQFWGMYSAFSSNPGYRDNIKGLVRDEQVRGQAWSMRTLAEAAYISPDNDPLKADFQAILNNNLDWFNTTYSNNVAANQLGVLVNGNAMAYDGGKGMAPWQDDFFTSAIGHAAELGFDGAKTLLAYKTRFAILRMTDPGACWIDGSIYSLNIRDTAAGPFYTTMGQAYRANHTAEFAALACGSTAMASSLGLKVGEMTGYSSSATGYPSNMQPALAFAADVGGAAGKSAWAVFSGRSVKPLDYNSSPQFNILPR
jgi:hypothetical protein